MKFLLLVSLVLVLPALANARMSEGGMERYWISGFYGLGSDSPSDVNNYLTNQGGTPALGKLSSGTFYGGEFGIQINQQIAAVFQYDQQDSKNPSNTSLGNNAGMELQQNDVWGGVRLDVTRPGRVYAYVEGLVGYPTYAHAIYTTTTSIGYDASKQVIYQGKAGLGFSFNKFLSLFFEGGYQFMAQGSLANGSVNLMNGSSNVKMDLSGVRGDVGLSVHF